MDNNELMHHGVRGMKWGVRRYQNKDGSLTAAGKKRYEKEMARLREEQKTLKNKQATKAKLDKLNSMKEDVERQKRELNGDSKPISKMSRTKEVRKSPKEMSYEELQTTVNRMNLEARYDQLNPEKVSAGKRFVQKVLKDVVVPATTEVARNTLKTILADKVGKVTKKNIKVDSKDK